MKSVLSIELQKSFFKTEEKQRKMWKIVFKKIRFCFYPQILFSQTIKLNNFLFLQIIYLQFLYYIKALKNIQGDAGKLKIYKNLKFLEKI